MLRNFILSILFSIVFGGCSHDNPNKTKILLLRVDYLTKTFEGGKELILETPTYIGDSLPILIDYQAPGDFGNIALSYKTVDYKIFEGSIIWMGCGEINYPAFNTSSHFSTQATEIEMPDTSAIQYIHTEKSIVSDDLIAIWNSVNHLKAVSEYAKSHKKIGLFLYTPSVGIGNPADWDYFLLFNK